MEQSRSIAFLHPDLGIGGAERAVVDAGLALKSRGREVQYFTSHHSPAHCFPETADGTFRVTVAGDWLPRAIFGRCYALCAYLRMIYLTIYFLLFYAHKFDAVFVDQISAGLPLLKLFSNCKILFYCHFPDLLLTHRDTFWKSLYRKPLDYIEEKTTGLANVVLVNSEFTRKIFYKTFPSLRNVNAIVVYPIPKLDDYDTDMSDVATVGNTSQFMILSINRYERKKNIILAIRAFALLKSEPFFDKCQLVIAGGYDDRVKENKDYYEELVELVNREKLEAHVSFYRSVPNDVKASFLRSCFLLLYTPSNEHFGIVPVEAMHFSKPVIAVNSGGPCETVADGESGFLCEPTAEGFSAAIKKLITKPGLAETFGRNAKERVSRLFSFDAFARQICDVIDSMFDHSRQD